MIHLEFASIGPAGEDLHVLSWYRPPTSDPQAFLVALEKSLDKIGNKKALILGDLNIRLLSQSSLRDDFVNIIHSYSFCVTNSMVTREASNDILDYVISYSSTYHLQEDSNKTR